MTLSQRVGRPRPKPSDRDGPPRRPSPGPFGGMNVRETRETRAWWAGEAKTSGDDAGARPMSKRRDAKKKPGSDYKALKMQRTLSPISYGQRTSTKSRISQIESFDEFSLLPEVRDATATQALTGMDNIKPTPIQRLAIPALLGGGRKSPKGAFGKAGKESDSGMQQFLLAAETGSGKTLAYLLPVIDALKRAEALDKENEEREAALREEQKKQNPHELDSPTLSNQPHPTTGRPRAIVLVPTSELVAQVGSLAKKLSHTVKFRSALLSSSYSGRVIRNRLFSPTGIDVLISTPHLVASIAESDPNILSRVTHIVIDEADSLLDRSFAPTTSAILDRASPSLRQLILCSATIPRSLDSFVHKRFPDAHRLTTPNLHAIPRRVQLGVVDIDKEPYRGNRSLACADTIWSIGRSAAEHAVSHGEAHDDEIAVKRMLVFVNEREKAQEVADFLVSKGIDAAALSRDTPEQRQAEILSSFTTLTSDTASIAPDTSLKHPSAPNFVPANRSAAPTKRVLPNTKVLVTTDLGSRGIDTLAVRHVLLYDVPHTTIDFIHRLGRTGRMGRRGRGIVLVGKNDRKDIVKEVREGMYKGQALI
ncbi:MAG: RNA helicase [Piccolia ochrophora]|nr:MAG: RNA helicase [Piccolia ochrophora]